MADFLLELLTEEIPARMQAGARAELEKLFRAQMDGAGVTTGEVTVWSTPRRLALMAKGLPTETEAVSEEAKGPPVGAPDQAVDGFCRKNGVERDRLEVRDVKGRETYFAVIEKPGQAVSDLLATAIPAIIRSFSWPKSMRWGEASISSESLKWVRPLTGIIALLDGDVVSFEVDGIVSGRTTRGHRFHSAGLIAISGADAYAGNLREASVIVDHEERAAIIREGARKAAEAAGLKLVEDEGLVIENAGLTEWPEPLLGRFDEAYLDVPPEVIQLTARVNQKYFVCENADGQLANAFICTANIDAADPAVVVDGNRKVLAARLSDARFFWELDQKTPLAEHAKGLERITFHEKLGTVAERCDRVGRLFGQITSKPDRLDDFIASGVQLSHASKADLVTEMVGEFPELQGLMGYYYANVEGARATIAEAVRDHYLPIGPSDPVPESPVSYSLAMADKLEQVSSFFAIDERPTGSKDPFALRRAALGVIRIVLEKGVRARMRPLITLALNNLVTQALDKIISFYEEDLASVEDVTTDLSFGLSENLIKFKGLELPVPKSLKAAVAVMDRLNDENELELVRDEIFNFFIDRLKVQQREAGVRHDLIDAVFALGGEDDLVRLLARVKALQAFVETDNGKNLLAGYKRAANILKKEEWSSDTVRPEPVEGRNGDGVRTSTSSARTDAPLSYTPEPAEKALIDALDVAEPKATAALEAEDFEAAMSALATLRAPIDAFFEGVTVNDDDADKRAARLDLLARFRNAVHRVADFSRIEG